MPVTVLDPRTALIIIDLQKGIIVLPAVHPFDEVVHRAASIADAFRQRHLPVVLVNADGSPPGRTEQATRLGQRPVGWTDLLPELKQQPEDLTVTKRTWGAFANTDLREQLDRLDVTQVVIAGVATSAGVESTAREAHALGYNVTLAVDAMTDLSAEAHRNSVTRIFRRLGETGTSEEIVDLLGTRSA
jgi:nicotinamidase-related amidase